MAARPDPTQGKARPVRARVGCLPVRGYPARPAPENARTAGFRGDAGGDRAAPEARMPAPAPWGHRRHA